VIGGQRRLCTGDTWHLRPECFGTVTTASAHVQRHELVGGGVHGAPDPWLVGFRLHNAPQLIGLSFQSSQHSIGWMLWQPDMLVIRTGCKALHNNV
jgi:hypothetical protein